MTTQSITIELPEAAMRQLMRIAEATHQQLEVLVAQSILNNLPPSSDHVPPEMQEELLAMQVIDIEELRSIAESIAPSIQVDRQASTPANIIQITC